MDIFERSIHLHKELRGKITVENKLDIRTKDDLSLAYSPGVAAPCEEIHTDPSKVYDYTIKGNTIAIVSDGSAVLGLGNIGAHAAIPVMEGKAMLFKRFAGINGFPICISTQKTEEIISIVKNIAPVFGGINLEDISSPRCFEIEERLQDIGIPVFHDDQHGTAIVVLAALMNYCRLTGRKMEDLKIVINGAGAAGIAIARYLGKRDREATNQHIAKEIVMCDTMGIIHKNRLGVNDIKEELLSYTNPRNLIGTINDALLDADVFIGVSKANLLNREHIRSMAKDPLILALANPIPEILPEEAIAGGAFIVCTGRSDFPNQVNNVLAFPGIFLGALHAKAKRITLSMKFAAAAAIASAVEHPTPENIIPSALDETIAHRVAKAVSEAAH
ncbi:MAG: NADP-dependent malic enzyme [Saprospiraceae bacterium]|nr:NADP-dependent malic enzyme [Saprospiraceae bacterium]MBK8483457.1 NADP-dependent malic enzyme [Saprospiraceae bacterium]MBK9220968.1 NADP-dependent malic enzyme [Saprospiraceae bacterium]MBK9722187.1 NADP-dependent malic enzyme [Saprospiraceae bacterium]MBK9729208.1 NADP-dependent malic enzyme [Saprospiraceae bacterium]